MEHELENVVIYWVLPPLSNSWIISIIGLYIALNGTPNIDCYLGGGSTQSMEDWVLPWLTCKIQG